MEVVKVEPPSILDFGLKGSREERSMRSQAGL